MNHTIHIYTDGAARGNPGPGGFGIVMLAGPWRKEISQGFRLTTNNRMELLSVIIALETLKKDGHEVIVFSDSKYVVDAIEKGWLKNWVSKGFKKTKNVDLWKRFLQIYPRHKVKFKWVRGHSDNVENNRCDELAVKASLQPNLPPDEGYERIIEMEQSRGF